MNACKSYVKYINNPPCDKYLQLDDHEFNDSQSPLGIQGRCMDQTIITDCKTKRIKSTSPLGIKGRSINQTIITDCKTIRIESISPLGLQDRCVVKRVQTVEPN